MTRRTDRAKDQKPIVGDLSLQTATDHRVIFRRRRQHNHDAQSRVGSHTRSRQISMGELTAKQSEEDEQQSNKHGTFSPPNTRHSFAMPLSDPTHSQSISPQITAARRSTSRSESPARPTHLNQLVVYDTNKKQLVVHETEHFKEKAQPLAPSHSHRRGASANEDFDYDFDFEYDDFDACPTCHRPFYNRFNRTSRPYFTSDYFLVLAEAFHAEQSTMLTSSPVHRSTLASVANESQLQDFVMPQHSPDIISPISSRRRDDGIDQTIFNQGYFDRFFVVEKELGRGTFGVVLLCRHIIDGSELGKFAVKKVPVGNDRAWLSKTLSEVTALQKLRHTNIIDYKHSWIEMSQAVDLGPSVPCLFILMEYAQGGSIHDLIHPRKPETAAERKKAIRKKRQGTSDDYREFLEEKDIWPLLHDTCQGLRYLHRLHIVHTDVKPPNLLLDMCPYNNRLKVLISDFGTSKQIESACSDSIQNRRSGNTGTIDFTAPEVLVCDEMGRFVNPFTEKADMWSLGVVLYEMAFGVLPWRENRSQQLPWQAQVTSQILDFDYRIHLPPDIGLNGQSPPKRSPELLEVIKSLLERSADLRPSSEEIFDLPAFQAGIERYVNTESVPRGRSRSVRSPSKRYHSTTLSPRSKYQVEEPQRSDHFQIQEIQRHSPPPLELQPFAHSSKTIQTDRKRPHQDTSEEESNSVSVLSEPPIHERDHQQSNEQLSVSRRESRELIPYSESLVRLWAASYQISFHLRFAFVCFLFIIVFFDA
eukprot:TRINITY_DN6448_c0_g1_i5.p1 TRINITY_DN6448_c0_g1~~TRINITY_DN6448_c0_g1_i5.p1  ORF type:complete len:760 (+),score=124.69 TRINITY_DN6448_c0_g1_i5:64-2343(+)